MSPDFPTLQTPRLRLRELLPADAPAFFDIHRDADAMRWFGTDPLTELAEAEQVIEGFRTSREARQPGIRWGLQQLSDDQLLGSCGLFRWNRGWRSCGLGYELAPAAQGQGLMREALQAVLGWGFEHWALNRVEAQVHPANQASLGLLQRLGFQREGRMRQAGFWQGAHRDLLLFSLLREDWDAKRGARLPG
ncbi:MAG TPA: GNAT family protein [Ideonella sp.]|uniref:GNAT family N-acetyltransferase n=1 Tax=Ideonella sp. TaxID=1929293 RepID=UPI002C6F80B0|nr:GNAT family protein [Ideonella sp.]HSI52189.1 GNAT family protein [Ideonella sp.]